jgi:hypothetical protein
MKSTRHRLRSERGSLIVVTLLLSCAIALTLTAYLTVASNAVKLSSRSYLANSAVNLAEIGLELTITNINSSTWSGWTLSGSDATRTFSGFNLSAGATGIVQVYAQNYASTNPTVIAKATVTPKNGATIDKWIVISGFIQRSYFARGLVGKNGLVFNGNNATVDSWDPTQDDSGNARSPTNYNSTIAHARGSIAAVNVSASADVNNADIYGTASVGNASLTAIDVGPQGRVGPFGTAAGVKDANSVSTNFTTNLPNITAPSPGAANINVSASNISGNKTLPGASDIYVTDSTGKKTYYYQFPAMTGGTLTISANSNVVLLPTAAAGTNAISLSGNHDGIVVSSGATLNIYTPANISVSGQASIGNANGSAYTSSLQIWGTATASGQTITVTGNGVLEGTIYAPNAAISAKGGGNSGSIYGAFVGNTVTMTGNDAFHYDESLGRLGSSGNFAPSKWIELTKNSDRATYASHFNP